MCGRFACALASDDLSCASSQKDPKTGLYIKTPCIFEQQTYNPSYNIAPTTLAPIIIEDNQRAIVLAQFGVIPPWLSPEVKNTTWETHLCRLEGIKTSKLYKRLLQNGLRCVIPCIGFFEWQSTKGPNRQPYFFYNKENSCEDILSVKAEWSEKNGWTGVKLLHIAGLYSKREIHGKIEYSFTIITEEEEKSWKWVHHRIPAILQNEEHVNIWLNSKKYTTEQALEVLKTPITNLDTYPVDKSIVNNTRNNVSRCVQKFEPNKPKNNFMSNWVQKTESKKNFKENVKKEAQTVKKSNFMTNWLKKDETQKSNLKTEDTQNKKRVHEENSSFEDGNQEKKIKEEN